MHLSKWSISQKGQFSHSHARVDDTPLRIVMLDDHELFRKGLIDYCIRPFFRNIEIIEIENGDEAYSFITNEIQNNSKLNLIITDINHPGMRGHELVKAIRACEKEYASQAPIPIIVITMVEETRFPDLRADKMVNQYFSKATEAEVIVNCLEEILFK